MQKKSHKQQIPNLSDKDIHAIRKTYSKLAELFYQNDKNQSVVNNLITLGSLIPQVISTHHQAAVLGLLPTVEPLKIKSKSQPKLKEHVQELIAHIKNPQQKNIEYATLLPSLQRSDLFAVGCTVAIRFYQKIRSTPSSEFNWRDIISELARNIAVDPTLGIELTYLICRQNQNYGRWAVKSGLTKFVFLSYIGITLDNRYTLYKAIKLLKVVASHESTLLREKEKGLALVIYTYDDYVPVTEGILASCYDQQYCQGIDNQRMYDPGSLDQPYLWSYLDLFCLQNLSEGTVKELIQWLKKGAGEVEQKKIYGILSNFSKFRKAILKEVLLIFPKTEAALLNFIKLCVNCCQLDNNSHKYIDLPKLEELVSKSPNPKVDSLFKYLKQMKNKENKIGQLSDNYKKMFDMEKNADFMMEWAARIPQKNQDLVDIREILKEKDRTNEFQSDTLQTIKERALNSLHTAIMLKRKLDLNRILREVNLGGVKLLAKLLQILELCLTINEDLIVSVDVARVLEIIQWIEDNYQGQLIEWGSISQLLIILTDEGEWKLHFHQATQKCFWLLSIQSLSKEEESLVWDNFSKFGVDIDRYRHKIPFLIGFLSRALASDGKLRLFNLFPELFQILFEDIRNNKYPEYKISLIMLSAFLKNWHIHVQNQNDEESNQVFVSMIEPLAGFIIDNFRGLEQEYQLLENCLPYQIRYQSFSDNLDHLIAFYGRLASYMYRSSLRKGEKLALNYGKIKRLGRIAPQSSRNMLEILRFLEQNSDLLQSNLLAQLLLNLAGKEYVYWLAYPNFFNVLSKIISILSLTLNSVILANLSAMVCNMINLIVKNEDISPDEKNDLFSQIKKCLLELSKRGVNINKEQIKKQADKIPFEDVRLEVLQIIHNYKISQDSPQLPQEADINVQNYASNIVGPVTDYVPEPIEDAQKTWPQESAQMVIEDTGVEQKDKSQGQIGVKDKGQGQIDVLTALRKLKRIIENKEPEQSFPLLYHIFAQSEIIAEYIDILGHLLVSFYPNRPEQMQLYALELLMDKNKTRLSRQCCYRLLSQHPQTFILSRRWRLRGREWIDLSMKRFSEGYYADASLVAQHNITKTSELDYFFSQNYHGLVINSHPKISQEQDHTNTIILIGTSARNVQIKQKYYRDKFHIKIIQLVNKYLKNSKFFANMLYALSSLVYTQQEVCADLISFKKQLKMILEQLKEQVSNKAIVESGACLIANLSYSNQQVKQTLRQLNVIPIFVFLFQAMLQDCDLGTFKQILRAFGNLSLSAKCSHQLIDQHFCRLAVRMTEKIDIFVGIDDRKAPLLKTMLDLVANLASQKYKYEVFQEEGIPDLLIMLLQTTQTHLPILTASIDTIDCLCQSPQIQDYIVSAKMITFILVDILKIHTDQKLVVKSTRLLTNLTINPGCIPHILKANLLSVMANIVMPHFYGNKVAAEQNKKMQTYILKIVSRIYHFKPDRETILQSGYLDCLIRTIQTSQNIEDTYIDLLYVYSDMMPHFLNKRAFICLIRILTKKITSKEVTIKCLRAIKKLSAFYERDEQDFFIQGISQIYQRLLTSETKDQGLELLTYHLFRSGRLREHLRNENKKVMDILKKMLEGTKYLQSCRLTIFLIHNPYLLFPDFEDTGCEKEYQELKKGMKCKLYRSDGSSKKACIDMNEDYQIRAYKYPEGEIKSKYVIDIRSIKDFQFAYPATSELWQATLFAQEKGIFDSGNCQPKNCCSLVSSKKWGAFSFINVEFESEAEKIRFQHCVRAIYNSLK